MARDARVAFQNGCWSEFGKESTKRFCDGSRERDQILWDRASVDAEVYQHLPEANILVKTRSIAANSAANTIYWWMSVGFL